MVITVGRKYSLESMNIWNLHTGIYIHIYGIYHIPYFVDSCTLQYLYPPRPSGCTFALNRNLAQTDNSLIFLLSRPFQRSPTCRTRTVFSWILWASKSPAAGARVKNMLSVEARYRWTRSFARLRSVQINVNGREETAIAAYWVTDGTNSIEIRR